MKKNYTRSEKIKLLNDIVARRVSLSDLQPKRFRIYIGGSPERNKKFINDVEVSEEEFWEASDKAAKGAEVKYDVKLIRTKSVT